MLQFRLVLIVALTYYGLATVAAVRCLNCLHVPSPLSCNIVTECAASEQCFVGQGVSPSGNIYYSMGCISSQRCGVGKRLTGNLGDCQDCCNGDYCNMEGCGTKLAPLSQRGPQCFACDYLTSPETCRTIKTCGQDQVCGLIQNPTQTWSSQCMNKLQCAALEKLQNHLPCDPCCNGDFCNDRCKHSTKPVIGSTVAPNRLVRCLQCDNMAHPSDCNLVTSCVPEDMCYINQYVTRSGLVRYKSGCMPSQQCKTKRRFVMNGNDGSITVCSECCRGNFCNLMGGCGTAGQPHADRRPICFDCPLLHSPYACERVTRCEWGEVCSIFKKTDDMWESSCVPKIRCAAISSIIGKRRDVTSGQCALCCSDDFCNESCNHKNATHIPVSVG